MDINLFACIKYILNSNTEIKSRRQLQLLLYYAYCWYMTINADDESQIEDFKLFTTKFEAQPNGPTIPDFSELMIQQFLNDKQITLSKNQIDILNQVLDVYGILSETDLILLSTSEKPWQEARGDTKPLDICHNTINDKTIYNYYVTKLKDK